MGGSEGQRQEKRKDGLMSGWQESFFFFLIIYIFFYFSPMMKGLRNAFIHLKGKHSGEETNSDVMRAEKVTLEVKEQAASASL